MFFRDDVRRMKAETADSLILIVRRLVHFLVLKWFYMNGGSFIAIYYLVDYNVVAKSPVSII